MKYPQLMHMPRHVEDWLERELEARGIDGVAYTRYILSLLRQDSVDDPCDLSICVSSRSKGSWRSRKRGRRDADSWHSWHGWQGLQGLQGWQGWSNWDPESLKRLAAVRCLMSASDEKCDIETLVDELCAKLKEIHSGSSLLEIIPSRTLPDSSSCSPGDPASRYYAAFPALKGSAAPNPVGDGSGRAWGPALEEVNQEERATDPNSTMEDDPLPLGLELQLQFELTKSETRNEMEDRENLECLIAKFDPRMQEIWNSGREPATGDNVWSPPEPAPAPYKSSFSDWNQLSGGVWGVGLMDNMLDAVNETLSTMKKWSAGDGPDPVAEEEDLLTSAKTHFRPIRAEEIQPPQPPQTAVYADGTTFAICNELEDVKFRRSDSGTLYLETDVELDVESGPRKYMEYKEKMEEEMEEFVPKFRVRQSNEKCCQTEDMDQEVCHPSPPSTVSSPDIEDEFYFPGDEELVQNLINNSLDEEKEADCNHNSLWCSSSNRSSDVYTAGRGAWESCGGPRGFEATHRRLKADLMGSAWKAGGDCTGPNTEVLEASHRRQQREVMGSAWEAGGPCTGPGTEGYDATHRRLRAELTEDGEQLLSDLSCVTQIYSLYDDDPSAASSNEATDNFHNERLRQLWSEAQPRTRQAFIT